MIILTLLNAGSPGAVRGTAQGPPKLSRDVLFDFLRDAPRRMLGFEAISDWVRGPVLVGRGPVLVGRGPVLLGVQGEQK